jgi:ribosomal protein S15P/S13E
MNVRLSYITQILSKFRLWKKKPLKKTASLPLNIYHTCANLPLSKFISCICDNDLNSLIITGTASNEQLEESWILILSEYQELKDDTIDSVTQIRLTKEIKRLKNHLFLVDTCVHYLTFRYSESIAKSLQKLGYTFKPKSTIPSKYINELTAVVNRSNTRFIELQQNISQLKKEIDKLQDGIKITRSDFENKLIYIEEMQKVSYDMDKLTVQKFVLLEKKFEDYIKHKKNVSRKD